MTSTSDKDKQREGINKRRLLVTLLALPVYFALFMFLPAGTLTWMKGWLFLLVFLGIVAVACVYLWRVNPEVVVARSQTHTGTKRWDRVLLYFFFPATYSIVPVAALDDGRFHWFPVPWWVCVSGYVLLFVGMGIITWAQAVNRFFEPTVRIQTERGHKVIDTGPYAIVRHPGYVSAFFTFPGMALSLGSLWALLPACIAVLLLILRTLWEDKTLKAELPGYKEYTERVRYRLIPGVW